MSDYMIQLADLIAERLQCDQSLALEFITDIFESDLNTGILFACAVVNSNKKIA